ncbi:MAG: sulfite exporter TauE/SafE family protein [Candidatus Thiodiazotropha sp. (ex Lucinoma aequizonata)]|nr:sulfite exporter TauE/SafE family protein [Candidatus Thiodiazotropha sp. (ex Lucinoma aequizonata)]MCU7887847.1 sulfite exporter TauE/SafE family protein [Candidatus Thiodiazotropha sp. (ex Lucinoma aequizonata)]MCU7896401.1 sulfite exporter TauE/SafE family protein [Candidatus Thiodiazotropha sp. (ex Lucinoma aequizonata)]MCU7898701.1 sulfite exporter TauE/SafE family protein [Candidatus Thiodiazotropha sp. (ex Lucinoma aequizonata)]MCU7901734.1 sulfite exporter TauE/SafE family protein [C
MIEQGGYVAAFVVGLLGGGHCVGMCGGIVGAMTFWLPKPVRKRLSNTLPYQLGYNLGRVTSYVVAGGIMGGLGLLLAQVVPIYIAQQILLAIAGLFMILLGLYLGGWWARLARIERLGNSLWTMIEPFARKLLPVKTPGQAWVLGLVWGWIPCGLVYSMLVWTVLAGSIMKGAGLMLAFGLGTLPNLFAMGIVAGSLARWLKNIRVRRVAGIMVILFGILTIVRAL